MSKYTKEEFYRLHTDIDPTLESDTGGWTSSCNKVWEWIEQAVQEARLLTFHEGYQTRCDEDDRTLTIKAQNAINRRMKVYEQIIKARLNVDSNLNFSKRTK